MLSGSPLKQYKGTTGVGEMLVQMKYKGKKGINKERWK